MAHEGPAAATGDCCTEAEVWQSSKVGPQVSGTGSRSSNTCRSRSLTFMTHALHYFSTLILEILRALMLSLSSCKQHPTAGLPPQGQGLCCWAVQHCCAPHTDHAPAAQNQSALPWGFNGSAAQLKKASSRVMSLNAAAISVGSSFMCSFWTWPSSVAFIKATLVQKCKPAQKPN